MDSHSVFPFLRLPAELRLEIYKDVWTVPEAKYVYRRNLAHDNQLRLSLDYLTAQLSAIRKLGAISQRTRAEAYPEYFDHTQIILRYDDAWNVDPMFGGPAGWDERNRRALYILSSSYLLQTQARHVYLHWPARDGDLELKAFFLGKSRVRARRQQDLLNEQWVLECVSRFKNLRSLDVHVDNGSAYMMTDHYWKDRGMHKLDHPDPDHDYDYKKELKLMFYDDKRRANLIEGLKTHHRKLEKAVVRTDISDPEVVKLINEHKAFKWWRRLKKDVAVLASEGPSSAEEEKEDTYVFKQHIGGLRLCWPRAYTVSEHTNDHRPTMWDGER